MMGFQTIKRVLYVVPVLGAMAFGASQAFASPAQAQAERACTRFQCVIECGPTGGVCKTGGSYCICY